MFEVRKPLLGANYYPEAWDRSLVDDDLDKMVNMGINCVRIAEFAWKTMEPSDGVFDFSLFREVVDKCRERGISVIFGTPSACPPRWLEEKYPDILLIGVDGVKMEHGARRNVCPSNEVYRKYCARIAEEMAKEFGNDENVIGWQIDNEISPVTPKDYGCCCDGCLAKFKDWMRKKYGTVENMNKSWGAYVWSVQYDDFDQLSKPHPTLWTHPSFKYDWLMFQTDMQFEFMQVQVDAIKKHSSAPIGHDAMPTFALDYNRLREQMDVIQFNQYYYGENMWKNGFWYDFLRPIKKDVPFWMTETSCCWNGSTENNNMRPKNFNVANVWLAVTRGAELVDYWLWKEHYGGHELGHGACLTSTGRPIHVAGEIKTMSEQLTKNSELLGKTKVVPAPIAIMTSHDAYKLFRTQKIVNGFSYTDQLYEIYRTLASRQIRTDLLTMGGDKSDYKVIMTPFVTNLDEAGAFDSLAEWTKNGGTWLAGPFCDIRTQSAAKYTHAFLGHLEELTGAKVEFSLPRGQEREITFKCGKTGKVADLTADAYALGKDCTSLATYSKGDYLEGKHAIVSYPYGKGRIILMGALPEGEALVDFLTFIGGDYGVKPLTDASESVYTVIRSGGGDEVFAAVEIGNTEAYFVAPFDGEELLGGTSVKRGERVELAPYGVALVKRAK